MISSPEPSVNNKSLVFVSLTSQPHLIPSTLPFFLIDSLPGLAFTALPFPGSTPTSPTVPSSHPAATPNPPAVPLSVASHKAQSLVHFCSPSTLPHLVPFSTLPASVIISTPMIHNFSSPFRPQSSLPQSTFYSHLSLKSLLGCLLISFLSTHLRPNF